MLRGPTFTNPATDSKIVMLVADILNTRCELIFR